MYLFQRSRSSVAPVEGPMDLNPGHRRCFGSRRSKVVPNWVDDTRSHGNPLGGPGYPHGDRAARTEFHRSDNQMRARVSPFAFLLDTVTAEPNASIRAKERRSVA